ncbi:hypothetical protein [Mariniblastus fucicola]|uniref:Uncharacterized protein n=1 Tax=Mariniblastus fucicola TaxID=980251 RepID=A0A5B9P7G0_9BACT|nr:hypothetical protein [Mariniblastus fucicola]QEG20882.1 hypothetical protein MFFC18_07330 [Mariniblastus fucicola]
MLAAKLILGFLCCSISLTATLEEKELPSWTSAPEEPRLFVVETKEFSTHFAATENLMPAVKSVVSNWAADNFGSDCRSIIEAMPHEEIRDLIHENQEIIHKFRREYDAETAKRLEADYDDFYRGYVRVKIHDQFLDRIKQQLTELRLRKRLRGTLIATLFVLGMCGILYGYLHSSRLTRGFYISRLRWIAGASVGLLVLICYLVYRMLL